MSPSPPPNSSATSSRISIICWTVRFCAASPGAICCSRSSVTASAVSMAAWKSHSVSSMSNVIVVMFVASSVMGNPVCPAFWLCVGRATILPSVFNPPTRSILPIHAITKSLTPHRHRAWCARRTLSPSNRPPLPLWERSGVRRINRAIPKNPVNRAAGPPLAGPSMQIKKPLTQHRCPQLSTRLS